MSKWAQQTWRWLQQMYTDRLGADATTLPTTLGGTGTTSVAQTVAAQQAATTSPSATALTQSKTGVALTRPTGVLDSDYADTTIAWDAAFADATYNVTLSFHQTGTRAGDVSLVSQTATQIVVRLFNVGDSTSPTRGTVDATGVHA
jgi:hypothetical protein